MATKKRWTEEDIAWLKANYPNLGLAECADYLGRTQQAVRQRLHTMGIFSPEKWLSRNKWTYGPNRFFIENENEEDYICPPTDLDPDWM